MKFFDPREFYVTGEYPGTPYVPEAGDHPVLAYGVTREVDFKNGDLPIRMLTLSVQDMDVALASLPGYAHIRFSVWVLRRPMLFPVLMTAPHSRPLRTPASVYSAPEATAIVSLFEGLERRQGAGGGAKFRLRDRDNAVIAFRLPGVLESLSAARQKLSEDL